MLMISGYPLSASTCWSAEVGQENECARLMMTEQILTAWESGHNLAALTPRKQISEHRSSLLTIYKNLIKLS